jgi:DNA (cytosine-5)-methyltransferase 1
MRHLDLFSGIGGFAYAIDQVWDNAEHIFCDNDKFCREVIKKHWPNSKIYDDIRKITSDTYKSGYIHGQLEKQPTERHYETQRESIPCVDSSGIFILTGGFPCQPFSQEGKRRGVEDDRHLWPEMLRVIRLTQPQWVIAENVRGIFTIEQGLVFEQVCLDLEAEGYEVQPFIIPAVSVNAPHRRDRVWFVANRKSGKPGKPSEQKRREDIGGRNSDASDTNERGIRRHERKSDEKETASCDSWERNWLEIASELCRVDDELSSKLDELGGYTKAQHRVQRLKSLGNAIVPAVAVELLKSIKYSNENM